MIRYPNPSVLGCVIGAVLLFCSPALRAGTENPFEHAVQQSYMGRFSGPEVDLRIVKDDVEKWTGTLVFHGKAYDLDARKGASGLEGKFAQGDKLWPFTAVAEGDTLSFTTEGVTTKLQRRKLPKLEGRWRSERVLVIFGASTNGASGQIQFNGQDYIFEAQEKAGDLEGRFKAGDKIFPFSIANEARGLMFKTGSFAEVLVPVADKGKLRVRTVPEVPFTLLHEGKALVGQNGVFELAGGQDFVLELRAKGYQGAHTNLTIPSYSETTWAVALQKLSHPQLDQPWTNSLGVPLVPVPGTKVLFAIWETRVQDYQAYAAANIGVDDSWRNVEYEGVRVSEGPTHPVTMVSWNDAKAFCEWLTKRERAEGKISESQSYRLPTDTEWSVAVGLNEPQSGTPQDKDGKIKGVYPWGTQWPPPNDAGNYDDWSSSTISGSRDGFQRTAPVGSFKANRSGIYDLGGNVWEWCEEQKRRVLRGGSWYSYNPEYLLSSYRYYFTPDFRSNCNGFRCVLVGDASP